MGATADTLTIIEQGSGALEVYDRSLNAAEVYLRSLSSRNSERTMRGDLEHIAGLLGGTLETFPWGRLTYGMAMGIRVRLQEQVSARTGKPLSRATISRKLSALRGVAKEAWALGQMPDNTLLRIREQVKVNMPSNKDRAPAGRYVPSGEIRALLDMCANEGTPASARDGAILALAVGNGPRRAEIVSLDLADVSEREDGTGYDVTIRHGKGDKARVMFVDNGAARHLARWLRIRGPEPGALFWAGRKGGHVTGRGMSAQAVRDLLARRCEQAGIRPASPHDLRRTFASDLLDGGTDINTVRRMMGHADVSTTAKYDRRGERAQRKAAASLSVPYSVGAFGF